MPLYEPPYIFLLASGITQKLVTAPRRGRREVTLSEWGSSLLAIPQGMLQRGWPVAANSNDPALVGDGVSLGRAGQGHPNMHGNIR